MFARGEIAVNKFRPWLPKEVDEFAALWASGVALKRIACQLGRTLGSCSNKQQELKLPARTVIRQHHNVHSLPHDIICQTCGVTETREYLTYPSGKTMARKATFCRKCQKKRDLVARRLKLGIEPMVIFWTDERKQKAAELWNAGKTSTDLATYFDISRSAACGIVHRLGLMGQRRSVDSPLVRKMRRRAKARERYQRMLLKSDKRPRRWPNGSRARPAARPSSLAPAPLQINLITLTDKQCHWPTGEGYCGHPKWEHHKSYCEHHAAVGRR